MYKYISIFIRRIGSIDQLFIERMMQIGSDILDISERYGSIFSQRVQVI